MRKLISFTMTSLDGYFTDKNGDMRWAKERPDDGEWSAFSEENAKGGGVLVFGRVTYDQMASFWPTTMAAQMMPVVAERMNHLPKIVISRTIKEAAWNNTTVLSGDLVSEIRRLKAEEGPDMAILGSGSIVAQLASAGLIDTFQVAIFPLALGAGRTIFDDVPEKIQLKLVNSRTFANGNVVLNYEPASL